MQEGLYGELIGCIKGGRKVAALSNGLICKAKRREGFHIRLFEGHLSELIEVHLFSTHGSALRIIESVLDRETHVRNAELGDNGAILIFHHGVNDALGMHEHLDLRGIHVKEPLGFDHFKSLVDEGGRVDGDLLAHGPGGVAKSVLRSYVFQILRFFATEGTAGCGEPDLGNLIAAFAVQGLEDRTVLAVHGEDRNTLLCSQRHDDVARCDQRLFVGQSDFLAGLDRGNRGAHADHAHDRCDKILIAFHGSHFQNAVHTCKHCNIQVLYADPEVLGCVFIKHDSGFGSEFTDLCFHQIDALSGAQCCYFDILLFSCYIQGLLADGTGRA